MRGKKIEQASETRVYRVMRVQYTRRNSKEIRGKTLFE